MKAFDKAALPKKVRLSGADCFHLVLDKHAKKHGAGGNVMRKIFYFNKPLSTGKIDAILKSSPVIYWLCNIKLVPGSLLRIPYWKYIDGNNEIILREHHVTAENEIPVNISERDITIDAERFIEADLLFYPSGACAFMLSWNHILLDAKGTTLLFDHLNHLTDKTNSSFDNFFPGKEKKPNIIRYIRNMYKVKKFVQTSSKAPVSSVADKHSRSSEGITRYKTFHFNSSDTKKILGNAFKTGSRFGPTLFFIACCSHVIHKLNRHRNKEGDIWLPVPYDGRLKGSVGPLISNCVAFLFYRLGPNEMNTINQTVKSLSAQMTAQIKEGMPQKYSMFLNMMRHIPLWLYYFLISRTGEGTFASFLYTSTGDNFNELKSLFGEPLSDLALIPALTFPPGFTFVFLKHDDELNVDIAYSPDVISDNDLHLIEQSLQGLLLADY
ncbi:hypothetical protein BH11BAC4_BH11BAC4_10370 [soil metagenome]